VFRQCSGDKNARTIATSRPPARPTPCSVNVPKGGAPRHPQIFFVRFVRFVVKFAARMFRQSTREQTGGLAL
jgi:hypothetical protein